MCFGGQCDSQEVHGCRCPLTGCTWQAFHHLGKSKRTLPMPAVDISSGAATHHRGVARISARITEGYNATTDRLILTMPQSQTGNITATFDKQRGSLSLVPTAKVQGTGGPFIALALAQRALRSVAIRIKARGRKGAKKFRGTIRQREVLLHRRLC